MSDDTKLRETFWSRLSKQRAGMLGPRDDGKGHMQPMTPYADPEGRCIWFIAAADEALVQTHAHGEHVHFTFQSPDEEFYACVRGTLEVSHDSEKLDELWNRVAAAWFPEGRDDPKVRLLKLTPKDAAVWTAEASAFTFGLEVLRATVGSKDRPDVGEHAEITL